MKRQKPRHYLDMKRINAFVKAYRKQHLSYKSGMIAGLLIIIALPIGIVAVQQQIHDRSAAYQPITAPMASVSPNTLPYTAPGCQIGGCSGEICTDSSATPIVSSCVWHDAYACLIKSRCEHQLNGHCGWTKTSTYQSCLKAIKNETSHPN